MSAAAAVAAGPVARAALAELQRQFAEGLARLDWDRIERATGRGRRQVNRAFAEAFAATPTRHFADLRAGRAEELLAQGHDVLTAAVQAGYSGPGRLHDALVARRGMTPGQARAEGAGVRIAWTVAETPLGPVAVAATERGLCLLALCSVVRAEEHLAELRRQFPRAELREDAEALREHVAALRDFLANRRDAFEPPLDASGTPFQEQVWDELRRLGPGETASYADIAARIGRPSAARAVAGACAANRIAIAIPCHRVVGSDGELRGYRWGIEWKRRLLELERAARQSRPR